MGNSCWLQKISYEYSIFIIIIIIDQWGAIISIDFKKAFDSLAHKFLYAVLQKFDFGNSFISWVEMAYKCPQFRVKNNGWISGKYKMGRGIRQGCPLSSLLFIMYTEIMSNTIRENSSIEGIRLGVINQLKRVVLI